MRVVAKFKVQSVTEQEGGLKTATLHPVYGDSEENKQFFKATPSGQIQLGVMNPTASDQFVPGRVFYVEFVPEDEVTKIGTAKERADLPRANAVADVPIGQTHVDAINKDKDNMSNR